MEPRPDLIAGAGRSGGMTPMHALVRFVPLLLLVVLAVALWAMGAERYLDGHALSAHAVALKRLARAHPLPALAGFLAVLAIVAASSLPGVTILALAGGYMFGTWVGGLGADVSASVGAVVVYGAVNSSLGAALRERAERSGGRLRSILNGVRDGAFGYILTARLLPASPFWVVSAAAALAGAPFRAYLFATVLGVLPQLLVYSSLGAGFGRLIGHGQPLSLQSLLTPAILLPLSALALLSLATTAFVHRRAIARWFGR
jgi:uncharacterized membrane protein YdjX (TVP38/TMEM64 family)